MAINSTRTYTVQISEFGVCSTISSILVADLIREHKNGFEYIYSLQEKIDSVLDLKVDESMYFNANRDNEVGKGIVTRTA